MAFEEDEQIIESEEKSNFFEEDPAYEADTYFGEKLDVMKDDSSTDDITDLTDEEAASDVTSDSSAQGFGEAIKQRDSSDKPEGVETDIQLDEETLSED